MGCTKYSPNPSGRCLSVNLVPSLVLQEITKREDQPGEVMMSKRREGCTDLLRYLHASGIAPKPSPSGHQALWERLLVRPLDSAWVLAGQCAACVPQRQPKACLHHSDPAHGENDRVTRNRFVPSPPAGPFFMPA